MNSIYEKLTTCLASVREKTDFVPETAIVLGSGLGDYAEQIKIETTIDYKDIKGFPTSTVPGHKGRFVLSLIFSSLSIFPPFPVSHFLLRRLMFTRPYNQQLLQPIKGTAYRSLYSRFAGPNPCGSISSSVKIL